MKKFQSLRIVFMWIPGFSVGSPDAQVKAVSSIVGVITTTDKQKGHEM